MEAIPMIAVVIAIPDLGVERDVIENPVEVLTSTNGIQFV
jgi:hypothetical protein